MRRFLATAVSALLLAGCGSGDSRPTTADVTRLAAAAGAELLHPEPSGDGVHTDDPVKYASNPPTSGPHAFDWAADGTYAGVEPPRTEQLVHAQEHGRIVIQYRPGLPQEQIDQLERLFAERPAKVILVENRTGMPCDVAVAAWAHVLRCRRLTPQAMAAIRAFRDAYVDQGPERLL